MSIMISIEYAFRARRVKSFEKIDFLYLLGKWNKTALMYAVKNGHSAVAAYLLRIGVNPCSVDTSGNTPIHYAAAYGWLHCLKMLIKAGADPNAANQWKVSRGPSRLANSSSSPSSYFFVVILYLDIFISMHVFLSSLIFASYMCILHHLDYHLHLLYVHQQLPMHFNSSLDLHPVCI